MLSLQWRHVDLEAGTITLPPGTTKNSKGRVDGVQEGEGAGRIVHDFRRTAARNLDRSQVSRVTAMQITGHLTQSIYDRYNIVSEAPLREAGAKVAAKIG